MLCSVDHHEVPRPQLRFRAARSTRAALQATTASQRSGGRADEGSLAGRGCVGTTSYGNGALPAQRSLDGETALLPSRVSRDVVPAARPLKARRVYNYLQAPRGSLYTMTDRDAACSTAGVSVVVVQQRTGVEVKEPLQCSLQQRRTVRADR